VGHFLRAPKRRKDSSPNRRIDWSDSWSDEDLSDFRAASLKRLDAEDSEDSHSSPAMFWFPPLIKQASPTGAGG
jgi:hypothetical protein